VISLLAAHYLLSGVLALVLLLVAAVVASAGASLTVRADRRAARAVDAVLPERPMWTLADLLAGDDDRDSGCDGDSGDRGVPEETPAEVTAPIARVVDPAPAEPAAVSPAGLTAFGLAYGRHSSRRVRAEAADHVPRHAKTEVGAGLGAETGGHR
jgi:hypothetical protein